MLKKISVSTLSLALLLGMMITTNSYAYETTDSYVGETTDSYVDETTDSNIDESTDGLSSNMEVSDNFNRVKRMVVIDGWRPWRITSKKDNGRSYGKWKFGTEGRGKKGGSLELTKSFSVSNTLTGTAKLSKETIEASVGFSIGKSFSSTATYSLPAPSSKKIYTIDVRNVYAQKKISQKRDFYVGSSITSSQYATAYTNKFQGFGFTHSTRAYK